MRTTTWKRRLAAAAGLLLSVTALAACGGGSGDGSGGAAAPAPETLVVGWTSDPDSFDPAGISGSRSRDLQFLLYEPLLQYDFVEQEDGSLAWNGNEVAPSLAESWEVDEATGTVTFRIRSGVTFAETGNPLTAEDVRYSYERGLAMNGNNLRQAGLSEPAQFRVIDESTIAFDFKNADGEPMLLPTALPTLRYVQYLIVDSAEVKSHATDADPWAGEWLKMNPAGTGPYQVSERTLGQEVTVTAVPDHWAGAPGYDTITARITGDADMAALMKGGEVNVSVYGLSNRGYDDLEANGFTVQNGGVPKILRLDLAMDNPELADVRVRQAIAYAVPYEQIGSVVFSGRVDRATSWVNPQASDFTDAFAGYETDVDKARELMSEAGAGPFSLNMVYDSTLSHNEDSALLIQEALAEIDITVELQPQTNVQYSTDQATRGGGGTAALHDGLRLHTDGWWVDEAAPGISFWFVSTGIGNWAHWSDDDVDAIWAEHAQLPAGEERAAAFRRIQELGAEQVPVVPIVNVGITAAMAPGLTNFAFAPDGIPRLALVKPAS